MADTDNSQNSQKSSQFSQSDLPELLNQYYKRLFPYKYFVQWLSYGGGKYIYGVISTIFQVAFVGDLKNFELFDTRMILISFCWFPSTQDLLSKPRILVHAERWCLPALSIVCGSARTGEGNIETKPIQDWHWSCVHSQGSLLTHNVASDFSLLFITSTRATKNNFAL